MTYLGLATFQSFSGLGYIISQYPSTFGKDIKQNHCHLCHLHLASGYTWIPCCENKLAHTQECETTEMDLSLGQTLHWAVGHACFCHFVLAADRLFSKAFSPSDWNLDCQAWSAGQLLRMRRHQLLSVELLLLQSGLPSLPGSPAAK